MKNVESGLFYILTFPLLVISIVMNVFSPFLTFIFLIISFFRPDGIFFILFNISAVLYLLSFITKKIYQSSKTAALYKSPLDRDRPFLSAIIFFINTWLISFIFGFILSIGDLRHVLQMTILFNWSYKLIFMLLFSRNKTVKYKV